MFLFIEKLKISNFLSFFGEQELGLKPFSAIMCNFYEGKDDFFRAFEFVLGADLVDLRVENPLELVHKVLREEFLVSHKIQTYVEIVISLPQEKKLHKFSRIVKFGHNSPRLEHKISDIITSSVHYKEKLQSLNLFIKEKNSVFYKTYFNSVIWGSSEDLEMTICNCLRESYTLEEWKKAKKKVDHHKVLKERMAKKHYNSMKNSHFIIARHVKNYETVLANRETLEKKILQHLLVNGNETSDENSSSQTDSKTGDTSEDFKEKKKNIESLEMKIENLKQTLIILQLREAPLTSCLHHEEIKLAAKPVNASILQNRISQIKLNIREKENQVSEIWKKMLELKSEMEGVDEKILDCLVSLKEMEVNKYLQNRLTTYGRLADYLQPSRHVQLLRQIIGADLFYANLCDSYEEALSSIGFLNNLKYEHREVFIPFENFSHKLKDALVASGEKGIQINTLEELLIFLCKLKYFDLIDEVPVIFQRKFNFDDSVPDNYVIYVQNNVHFANDGLICCKFDENNFHMKTEEQLEKDLLQLQAQEEVNYQKLNDLFFLRCEVLVQINSLEKDYLNLKWNWKKSTQRTYPVMKAPQISGIYEEYSVIFKHHIETWQKCESEVQQAEEKFFEEGDSSTSSGEESLQYIMNELENVAAEKIKIGRQLESLTQQLHALNATLIDAHLPRKYLIKFQNNIDKKKIFFEKEFKRLQRLMGEDELLNFLGSQEWRKNLIASLINDFHEIKTQLKISSERLQNIATQRKRKLYPLFEHCARYLSPTFHHFLGDALPFVEINFSSGEEKIHLMSCLGQDKINIVDIKHFNTFLKFACALSIFLEISKFENIPVVVFDDMEEFFPNDDNSDAFMDSSTLEKLIPHNKDRRFHLLMRTGNYLKHYIKKNSPGNQVRSNERSKDYTSGPTQIIYFTKGDLMHAADHYIWIQNQILPDEYISEYCNSYSKIHELIFEDVIN